ncbi:hypothetical protein G7Y89_g9705 [Cudoniella acicularis]|uniref:Glutamyl-tRNA(Gln) amidotransferase subunit A, mitochondrial n=1 Tax=Cudoniella acicularis TaxID=354080 RepID=A0A8H4RF55_9HELO|nr:hypothetical protein G7Y89_g9705 [Cudoniella acicularis]
MPRLPSVCICGSGADGCSAATSENNMAAHVQVGFVILALVISDEVEASNAIVKLCSSTLNHNFSAIIPTQHAYPRGTLPLPAAVLRIGIASQQMPPSTPWLWSKSRAAVVAQTATLATKAAPSKAQAAAARHRRLRHEATKGPKAKTSLNAFISTEEPVRVAIPPPHPNPNPAIVPVPPGLSEWVSVVSSMAVKDNIVTSKHRTTCGSRFLENHLSPFEAHVVEQARRFSVPISGKTNLDEFGMGSHSTNSYFGSVTNINLNPHRAPARSAGGSSGGSAVAVASGQCTVALGTDTGGSVRLPAAYTKTIGFKPSYGLLSRWGVIPYANSLDTVGILASKPSQILNTLSILRPHGKHNLVSSSAKTNPTRDPTLLSKQFWDRAMRQLRDQLFSQQYAALLPGEINFSKLRIGVPMEYNIAELEPAVRSAWQRALEVLQNNGATVVPISLPSTKHALSAYYIIAPAEAASNLSKYDGVRYGSRSSSADGAGDVLYSMTRGEGFGEEVKRRILLGSYTLSSEAIDNYFIKAQKIRRLVQRDFDRVFGVQNPLRPPQQFDLSDIDDSVQLRDKLGPAEVDFIVCPTAPTLPPSLSDVLQQTPVDTYMNDVFTVPASLAGLPSISIPITGNKQVAGIQIIGQYSDDARVITMASRLMKFCLGYSSKNLNTQHHYSYKPLELERAKPREEIDKEFADALATWHASEE